MALVTCYDSEGNAHQKEPIDAREACLHNGFTMSSPGDVAPAGMAESVPTMAELLAARETLLRRERELDEQAGSLAEQKRVNDAEAARLQEQGAFNDAEALRLGAWAASLEAEAARLATLAAPAPTEALTEAPAAPKAGKATK
ncbi:MAG: hypothetical protein K2X55_02325 [Burkholderiaceae bacterium]|nr:hypothetical protein [Burkholderiaceae bacterium]